MKHKHTDAELCFENINPDGSRHANKLFTNAEGYSPQRNLQQDQPVKPSSLPARVAAVYVLHC